jgi:hypothetical protein
VIQEEAKRDLQIGKNGFLRGAKAKVTLKTLATTLKNKNKETVYLVKKMTTKKPMNKKMMYALFAVVAIVVVVTGSGAYLLMNNGAKTVTVADATSLQYNSDVTYQGDITQFKWAATNMGATNMALHIDILHGQQGNYSYILNSGDKTAWVAVNGTWTNVSSDFTNQWNTWVGTGQRWTNDLNALTNWSGTGDCNYNDSARMVSIRIYNVAINPTMADSLFQHTA